MSTDEQLRLLWSQVENLKHDVHVLVGALHVVRELSPVDFGKCQGEQAPLDVMEQFLGRIIG